MKEITERERKIERALALLRMNGGHSQRAYHQAAQQGDMIDSSVWDEAEKRFISSSD